MAVSSGGEAEHPTGASLLGKNPRLLPTPALSWEEFEDFTERLLSAHRFCAEPLRHVTRVERWGRRGDKQDGIDFEGDFSDGSSASWQCKRQNKLTPGNVAAAVDACTFTSDVHHLVFSGEASRDARDEMAKHPRWELLDQRGLGRVLDDLPLHKKRDVLDATWGVAVRRMLLEVPGEDAFVSLDSFAADRHDPETLLNDLGPRVGREAELEALDSALDRSGAWPAVAIVTGPGGRGKTRLLLEALTQFQERHHHMPVLCLSPGRTVDTAALSELPQTPAVVVVDDAHQDPAAIALLLQYVRAVVGTQLVLSSRPSGTGALRVRIANAGYAQSQLQTMEVGEFKRSEAVALVDSLAEGLGLTPAARDYFAGQAVHSPYVAVIATNLIRRGELTTPIAVDAGLRAQVLARYQGLAAGEIEGVPAATVRRLLAVYAALGPVEDEELRTAFAEFCGLTMVVLLRVRLSLHDRGVLTTRRGLTGVVPDVLADDLLEKEAAVGPDATGFAEELWNAFGDTHSERLVTALADLDWRLARQGGPGVFGAVWEMVRAELRAADYDGLQQALGRLGGLAVTQPHALVEALEDIRSRLDAAEDTAGPRGDATTVVAVTPDAPASDADQQRPWWQTPATAGDVRQCMPELYGQCAASAPELLEVVLDALWALRRRDARPTHQHPGHAERVIVDRLANIGTLPDPSFPTRIVTRVRRWLAEPMVESDVVTPMFALRPLLAKEGERTYADGPNRLIFQPFAVLATWAEPLRNDIRTTLLEQGAGADLHRAAAAADLLGEGLRQPSGSFGRQVDNDEVLAWETDDLATLGALHTIAETTTSPVIRRIVRQELAWTAEHAVSLPVRHGAMTQVAALDELDDELAEVLLHRRGYGQPAPRGATVPTLEELRVAEAARVERDSGLSAEEREAEWSAGLRDHVDRQGAAYDALVARAVGELTALDDPLAIASALDKTCREVRSAVPGHQLSLWAVWRQLGLVRPDLAPGVALAIAAAQAGPLDEGLDQLLNIWAEHDGPGLNDWLVGFEHQRSGARLAVGTAFVNHGWTSRGGDLVDLYRRGTLDPEPEVRERFLMGAHGLLAAAPAETITELLAQDISPFAATRALQQACGYDGASWGQQLQEDDAKAVLDLVSLAGWEDYTLQQLVSGVARAHPRLVLDRLMTADATGLLPTEIDGLQAAFDDEGGTLVRWLFDQAQVGATLEAAAVTALVMDGILSAAHALGLETLVDSLNNPGLLGLGVLLRGVPTWPQQQPRLARRLLSTTRKRDADGAASVRAAIVAAMHPDTYGMVNGVSEALDSAIAAAAACAETETDVELRADFESVHALLEREAAWLLSRDTEDEDA